MEDDSSKRGVVIKGPWKNIVDKNPPTKTPEPDVKDDLKYIGDMHKLVLHQMIYTLNESGFDDQGYYSNLKDIRNTGDTGAYSFSNVEAIVNDPLSPNKNYYIITPEKADQAIGISAYDAALVQAHITGNLKIGLDKNELVAADVTNNGEITSQDAFYILVA